MELDAMLLIGTESSNELADPFLKVVEEYGINYSWAALITEAVRLRNVCTSLSTRNAIRI
jgi:hypothetical protein